MSLPRIVHGMPAEEYHGIDAMSASGLRVFARSPWHYKNRVSITPTKAMLRGTLVHCAQLEPDAMAARYLVAPEDAPKRPTKAQLGAKKPIPASVEAMAWWADFNARAAGREVIDAATYALTLEQLAAVKENTALRDLFAAGEGEVSVFWTDEATGVYCKARPDWVNGASIIDLKSTADESPNGFGRAAARMGYHIQAAHYSEGYGIAAKVKTPRFVFAAVTNARPVLAVPYELTDEIKAQAIDERRELLERYAWCVANNEWPSYGQGVQLLDFPAYAKRGNDVEFEYA